MILSFHSDVVRFIDGWLRRFIPPIIAYVSIYIISQILSVNVNLAFKNKESSAIVFSHKIRQSIASYVFKRFVKFCNYAEVAVYRKGFFCLWRIKRFGFAVKRVPTDEIVIFVFNCGNRHGCAVFQLVDGIFNAIIYAVNFQGSVFGSCGKSVSRNGGIESCVNYAISFSKRIRAFGRNQNRTSVGFFTRVPTYELISFFSFRFQSDCFDCRQFIAKLRKFFSRNRVYHVALRSFVGIGFEIESLDFRLLFGYDKYRKAFRFKRNISVFIRGCKSFYSAFFNVKSYVTVFAFKRSRHRYFNFLSRLNFAAVLNHGNVENSNFFFIISFIAYFKNCRSLFTVVGNGNRFKFWSDFKFTCHNYVVAFNVCNCTVVLLFVRTCRQSEARNKRKQDQQNRYDKILFHKTSNSNFMITLTFIGYFTTTIFC